MTDQVVNVTNRALVLPHLASMIRDLEVEATAMESSGVDFATQVMEQILGAETEEDLWRAQESGTIAGKDYTNQHFRLRSQDIEWKRSRQAYIENGGFPFFFYARVTDLATGEQRVVNCGGKTIVSMIYKLQRMGGFDPYESDGGRPLMIQANSAVETDYDYLTLKPVNIPVPASHGKKS